MSNLLLLVLFFPFFLMSILAFLPEKKKIIPLFSLIGMIVHFLLSLPLYHLFDAHNPNPQYEFSIPLIPSWGAHFTIAVDGINLLLILLTTFLAPFIVLAAYRSIEKSQKMFFAMLFLLQFFMLGTFMSQNLFVFYLFWEAMLIPMFFIIGIWGGNRRIYATLKFFLYTALGSILMLVAVLWLLNAHALTSTHPSLHFIDLYHLKIPFNTQCWLFAAFFISFAIKVPLFPFHTWLPDAHVEAPTAGSVVLAGILLKMGTYGIIKLAFPLFPQAAQFFSPSIALLSTISILYGALLAFTHTDIKKIIACSSISHLGFVVLGLCSFNLLGNQGAMIQMIGHGFTASALFLIVGMIYERMHTRQLEHFGGIAKTMPHFSLLTFLIVLGSLGLPGTCGFTGEFLVLLGYFQTALSIYQLNGNLIPMTMALLCLGGVILSALYMLRFAQAFLFGKTNIQTEKLIDINHREKITLAILVLMILLFGLYPKPFLDKITPSLMNYIEITKK